MISRRRKWSRRWAAGLGFGAGACVGMTLLAGGMVSAHDGPTLVPPAIERGLRDVLHTPPLLVRQGSRVTLRYDVVCQADGFGKPCALEGDVFVRRAGETAFRATPTRSDRRGRAGSFCRRPGRRPFLLRRHRGRRRQLDDGSRRRRGRSAARVGGARAHARQPRCARLRPGAKARRSCARRLLGSGQRCIRPHHGTRDGAHRPVGVRRRARTAPWSCSTR